MANLAYHLASYQEAKGRVRSQFITGLGKDDSFFDVVKEAIAALSERATAALFSQEDMRNIYASTLKSRRSLRQSLKAEGHDDLAYLIEKDLESMPKFEGTTVQQVMFEATWTRLLRAMSYLEIEGDGSYLRLEITGQIFDTLSEAYEFALFNPTAEPRTLAAEMNKIAGNQLQAYQNPNLEERTQPERPTTLPTRPALQPGSLGRQPGDDYFYR